MTDKEKAIVKAYNELGIPIDMDNIPIDGYKKIKPTQYNQLYESVDLLKMSDNSHFIRPKSLKGIDTNNGWTRVLSYKDIPESKPTGKYYMAVNFTITHSIHDALFVQECVETGAIIHVMPFELPELKPIY